MVQCYVTGCALIGNAALRRISLPMPPQAVMHDWWVALVSENLGKRITLNNPTILYRQHGENSIGARSWRFTDVLFRYLRSPVEVLGRMDTRIEKAQRQAEAFATLFSDRLSPKRYQLMMEFAHLRQASLWKRKTYLIRRRLWLHSWLRTAATWWVL